MALVMRVAWKRSSYRQDGSQREFTSELRNILEVIAKTGKYWHDWLQLKSLLRFRLAEVMQEYHDSQMSVDTSTPQLVAGQTFSDALDRLLRGLDSFTNGAPFTNQRLCELLLNPKDTYVNLDKLSLAFEKLLLVTSTESPSTDPYPSNLVPSMNKEEPRKDPVADETTSEVFTINGLHDSNGMHNEKQSNDEEMVDVEGIVDRPVQELGQHALSEVPVVQSDISSRIGSEEPSNGHMITSTEEGLEDGSLNTMAE